MPSKQLSDFKYPIFLWSAITPFLAPLSLWPVALISLVPLFICLQHQSIKEAIKKATCYGCGLCLAGASWVYISMYEHGDVSMAFAIGNFAILPIYGTAICTTLLFSCPITAVVHCLDAGVSRAVDCKWMVSQLDTNWLSLAVCGL